jgi:hypothetical protein
MAHCGSHLVDKRRVCYYAFCKSEKGETRVRFGLSHRREAQIDASLALWRQISELMEKRGCQLVRIKANGPGNES